MANGGLSKKNRGAIERLVACINAGDLEEMDEIFHDDAIMDWPQSGERVVGADNRRAIYGSFPSLPSIKPRRLIGSGDVAVFEATLTYSDGNVYQSVFIFELRDGRIAKETAYWSQSFDAPEWRAQWVQRI